MLTQTCQYCIINIVGEGVLKLQYLKMMDHEKTMTGNCNNLKMKEKLHSAI